jgi:hypothetical protein
MGETILVSCERPFWGLWTIASLEEAGVMVANSS